MHWILVKYATASYVDDNTSCVVGRNTQATSKA